ncbi:MurR/RpiR family transcriptional regulator [Sagittula stellata]|uniref:SIS domain protein n=1 Tax=Sagittula stellata (strain ATCC 700073 / DSM 11524 / E-37) TaxID=388399 RepID=A3JX79_SAGS3|nr:MurR/RpiR family transcriptional regulator [Sagittula stellata]EBA10115.1 SIS domain protein [Sagittula stellata E-37]
MTASAPPADYEELIRLIHDRFDGMSKTYQQIAEYLTQNPNEVAVLSVNASAAQCGIHASSFVRFAQALGYSGFKDLQTLFQRRLSTAAPGFEARKKALEGDLRQHGGTAPDALHDLVLRDIASLQDLLDRTDPEAMTRAAEMIDSARTVYLIGQLRSEPVVVLLRYILTMLGKPCVLLDAAGGLATHVARNMSEADLLIAVAFRFYANEVVNVVQETAGKGIPVIAISDSTLSPLNKPATLLFAVPEHDYTFSRSLAAPMCLAQALMVAVAARSQPGAELPRIPTVTTR